MRSEQRRKLYETVLFPLLEKLQVSGKFVRPVQVLSVAARPAVPASGRVQGFALAPAPICVCTDPVACLEVLMP